MKGGIWTFSLFCCGKAGGYYESDYLRTLGGGGVLLSGLLASTAYARIHVPASGTSINECLDLQGAPPHCCKRDVLDLRVRSKAAPQQAHMCARAGPSTLLRTLLV